jgi:hypothetical protein
MHRVTNNHAATYSSSSSQSALPSTPTRPVRSQTQNPLSPKTPTPEKISQAHYLSRLQHMASSNSPASQRTYQKTVNTFGNKPKHTVLSNTAEKLAQQVDELPIRRQLFGAIKDLESSNDPTSPVRKIGNMEVRVHRRRPGMVTLKDPLTNQLLPLSIHKGRDSKTNKKFAAFYPVEGVDKSSTKSYPGRAVARALQAHHQSPTKKTPLLHKLVELSK